MRFESAIYANGFDVMKRFELGDNFTPLCFNLPDEDTGVLIRAAPKIVVTDSSFNGLALTTTERNIEQDLIDNLGSILTGKKKGWHLLGCRAMHWKEDAKLKVEFYVFHIASRLFFTLMLDQNVLSDYRSELRFERVINDLVTGRFNN